MCSCFYKVMCLPAAFNTMNNEQLFTSLILLIIVFFYHTNMKYNQGSAQCTTTYFFLENRDWFRRRNLRVWLVEEMCWKWRTSFASTNLLYLFFLHVRCCQWAPQILYEIWRDARTKAACEKLILRKSFMNMYVICRRFCIA